MNRRQLAGFVAIVRRTGLRLGIYESNADEVIFISQLPMPDAPIRFGPGERVSWETFDQECEVDDSANL